MALTNTKVHLRCSPIPPSPPHPRTSILARPHAMLGTHGHEHFLHAYLHLPRTHEVYPTLKSTPYQVLTPTTYRARTQRQSYSMCTKGRGAWLVWCQVPINYQFLRATGHDLIFVKWHIFVPVPIGRKSAQNQTIKNQPYHEVSLRCCKKKGQSMTLSPSLWRECNNKDICRQPRPLQL